MKEKIEDKLQYIKDAGFELTDYETVDMLSTLIQEERKEAVEGFVGWTQLNTPVSARDVERLRELVKEYLESEGKE